MWLTVCPHDATGGHFLNQLHYISIPFKYLPRPCLLPNMGNPRSLFQCITTRCLAPQTHSERFEGTTVLSQCVFPRPTWNSARLRRGADKYLLGNRCVQRLGGLKQQRGASECAL